jgi:hypothetical protein
LHVAGLTSDLPELFSVDNRFWSGIQVALTARRELHSGLLSRLEEAQRGYPQRHEQDEPPRPRRAETEERGCHSNRHGQRDKARVPTLALSPRPDVGDGHQ